MKVCNLKEEQGKRAQGRACAEEEDGRTGDAEQDRETSTVQESKETQAGSGRLVGDGTCLSDRQTPHRMLRGRRLMRALTVM